MKTQSRFGGDALPTPTPGASKAQTSATRTSEAQRLRGAVVFGDPCLWRKGPDPPRFGGKNQLRPQRPRANLSE